MVEKVSCSSVSMQIFAAKVRKPCYFQESAMQKLRPWRVHSRNINHSDREGMDSVISVFLRSEFILLTKNWAHAAHGAHGCWFPEGLFQAHQQRSRAGCCHLCMKHWCSFLQFNEALIHKNWAMGPFDFSRDSQQHKAQHHLDCLSGEGSHLPADW